MTSPKSAEVLPGRLFVPERRRATLAQNCIVAAWVALAPAILGAQPLPSASAFPVIDIAREAISRLDPGMTSANIAIYGVRLGMSWDEARSIFDREGIPYLFAKTVPVTVYVAPKNATYYFVLNPGNYEIVEMGVQGSADLPLENRYLADCRHWRLTTARTYFFDGFEGAYVFNEEGESWSYRKLGFVLKWLGPCDFRFVLVPAGPHVPPPPPPVPPPPPPAYVSKIPFFVTGYYEPNTTGGLRRLTERLARGELAQAKYIDITDENYASLAKSVDREFGEIQNYVESYLRLLADYGRATNAMLDVSVWGFVDPRGLVHGVYVDSSVTTDSMTVATGTVLEGTEGNRILANLRAWHTMTAIDAYLLAHSPPYRDFRDAGRIRWHAAGFGVADNDAPDRNQRRIQLRLQFTN